MATIDNKEQGAQWPARLESLVDRARDLVGRDRTSWRIGVQPYRTFGTPHQIAYMARVLRDPGLAQSTIHDSIWRNLRASFHRFESDEIEGARVEASAPGVGRAISTSDEEGYLKGVLAPASPMSEGWIPIRLRMNSLPYGTNEHVDQWSECLIPSHEAPFGIISDIDDTVLHTQVRSRIKMVLWSAFGNAYSRLPLPGVSRLYRKLAANAAKEDVNPIFYVSSSPWNLYSVLTDFLAAIDMPKGPVLLRDMGIGNGSSLGASHGHKEAKIAKILTTYPKLPFILLGDSGEEDPAIYARTIAQFPGRILCAYIRDSGAVNRPMVDRSVRAAREAGSELLLVANSHEIESHAESNGWIE